MKKILVPVVTIAALAFAGAALAAPAMSGDSAKGKVLTDSKGMTLYTFDKDPAASRPATAPAPATGRR